MYSSTPSLDSSLVLNDSGSSSTSPSRLPRMLVENQPFSPSMRALKPGARIVFRSVWPVLKSLPQMGTLCSRASSWSAGISTVRLGAPLAKGTPLVMAFEHAGLSRRFLRGVRKDVPAAEGQVVQFLEGQQFPDQRPAPLGALTQANGGELGDGADGQRPALADQLHPGHKCCANGSHAGRENTQLSLRRCNASRSAHSLSSNL